MDGTGTQTRPVTVTEFRGLAALTSAAQSRTLTGKVLPWNETGATSTGMVTFEPGSMRVPVELSRVKLLAGHSPEGVSIGYATAWESRKDGLYMTFALGSSPEADAALTAAQEKTVDAFSIEASITERTGSVVSEAVLNAVALVTTPAFGSARVNEVHAELSEDLAEVPEEETEEDTLSSTEVDTETTESHETTTTTYETNTDTGEVTITEETTIVDKTTLKPGIMPGTSAAAHEPVHASLAEITDGIMRARQGAELSDVFAELSDITQTGMSKATAPAWLGELWSGVTYERRIVPQLTQAPLVSYEARGYRWTTKPKVAAYSGDKTDIPSTAPAVEEVTMKAQRWAGGNDIDRKFWDFGDSEMLAAYWRAMAESYAYETDKAAGKFVVDSATAITAPEPDIIRAVARGAIEIDQTLHTPATFALVNPADLMKVLQYSQLDAPQWMNLTPISDPAKWVTSEFVTAGTVIIGTKSAITHYELAGSPIRVEAEHLAKGGRDAALFGYTAMLLNKPGGIVKVTIGGASA